jgi:hypothetical protein
LSHELTIIKDTLEKAKGKTIPAQQTPFITENYDAVKRRPNLQDNRL